MRSLITRRSVNKDRHGLTYSYNDALDRLKTVTRPDGGSNVFTYADATNTIATTATVAVASVACPVDVSKTVDLIYDRLGRKSKSVSHDPIGLVTVQTVYDGMGRVAQTSNPYLSGSPSWTTTTYDALGRPIAVETPDGATSYIGYGGSNATGNTVTSRNPAGKWRQSQSDALGRVITVIEDPTASITKPDGITISNTGSPKNLTTTYTYDVLDNLLTVSQSGQSRSFAYDSFKRLLCASNPESRTGSTSCAVTPLPSSGVLLYTYDNNGNLATRVDPRSITTTLTYDKLNRVIRKSYSPQTAPTVSLCYDGSVTATSFNGLTSVPCTGATALTGVNAIGRLTWETNGNSSTSFTAFDAIGRPTAQTQTTTGTATGFAFQYRYSKGGGLE